MGILDRVGRVVAASFDALIEQAEDPAKSLEETLREMQRQLRLAKTELIKAVAAERQLKKRVAELEAKGASWEKRAELAVEHANDELAREALSQRRLVAARKDRTEKLRVAQRGNALEMKSTLEDMQRKFRDFSSRKNTIATKIGMARGGGGSEALGGDGSVFEQFRNLEERIEGVDDVFEAQSEVDQMLQSDGSPSQMSRVELEQRFTELEGASGEKTLSAASEIDDELAALKRDVRVRVR